jgi:hypothetical protein
MEPLQQIILGVFVCLHLTAATMVSGKLSLKFRESTNAELSLPVICTVQVLATMPVQGSVGEEEGTRAEAAELR